MSIPDHIKGGFPLFAETTRLLAVNIPRQFSFVKADFLSWQKPLAS